jgi:hypothetical protein
MVTAKVIIDNRKGWGAVPYNADVDYFGIKSLMKPSVFLKLALPLTDAPNLAAITDHIKQGGAIGAPFLDVAPPVEWEDENFDMFAKVSGHEGRNRMTAILSLFGDNPIETHLFVKQYRAREITRPMVESMQDGLYMEKSTRLLTMPGGKNIFEIGR